MKIDDDLIFLGKSFNNQDELFDFMADILFQKGYVTEEYRKKIKERESVFPTGFKLKDISVAIPHTDPEFTKASKIIFIKLLKPVEFANAEDNEKIQVEMIFGLVFENSDKHIDDLMRLANLLQDEKELLRLKKSDNIGEISSILGRTLN
ncbi:PTS sugar transporter subunit IIA [Brassicibacter mesophilus]|uniref:PTS sugar transporter subunit IIA n=1 Tax=Brassicibacter mesophilus TaxID=745119 RepID=UPI003D250196